MKSNSSALGCMQCFLILGAIVVAALSCKTAIRPNTPSTDEYMGQILILFFLSGVALVMAICSIVLLALGGTKVSDVKQISLPAVVLMLIPAAFVLVIQLTWGHAWTLILPYATIVISGIGIATKR